MITQEQSNPSAANQEGDFLRGAGLDSVHIHADQWGRDTRAGYKLKDHVTDLPFIIPPDGTDTHLQTHLA